MFLEHLTLSTCHVGTFCLHCLSLRASDGWFPPMAWILDCLHLIRAATQPLGHCLRGSEHLYFLFILVFCWLTLFFSWCELLFFFFLKSLLCLLHYCFCFMVFVFFWQWGMWNLPSLPRDWAHTPCSGRRSLNHWTTREVPWFPFPIHHKLQLLESIWWFAVSIRR